MNLINKIENMLLGVATGDSFGLGIEFQSREWIKENVDFTKYVNNRGEKHSIGYEHGFYSDDTEHTLGLMEALLDTRPFSENLLLEMWRKEYETDKRKKGFPRQGHSSRMRKWYEGEIPLENLKTATISIDPGCAPPMRSVPLGFVPSNLINDYATINAKATNSQPKAEAASILVARASEYMIMQEEEPQKIIEYCKGFINERETLEYIKKVEGLPSPEKLNESEFVTLCGPQPIPSFKAYEVRGLPNSAMRVAGATVYILKYSGDAFTGLKHSIQLGGDVDSIASICTGILGGRYGLESLPSFITEHVEGKERRKDISSRFAAYLQNSFSLH